MEPPAGVAPQLGELIIIVSPISHTTQSSGNPDQALRIHREACVAFEQDFYAATFQLQQNLLPLGLWLLESGCRCGIRTHDLLVMSQAT